MHGTKVLVLAALGCTGASAAEAISCDPFSEDQCTAHGGVHLVQRLVKRVGQEPLANEAVAAEESVEETWQRLDAMTPKERESLLNLLVTEGASKAATPNYVNSRLTMPGLIEYFCGRFTKSRWPNFMFWAQQIYRRLQHADPYPSGGPPPVHQVLNASSPEKDWYSSEKVRYWVEMGSKMACSLDYEPRKNASPLQNVTHKYMMDIMAMEGDKAWPEPPVTKGLDGMFWCSDWYQQNLCYVMAWADYLGGDKAAASAKEGEMCWDQVQYPPVFIYQNEYTFMKDTVTWWPEQIMPGQRDYGQCMDTPVHDVSLRGMCPVGHVAPPGYEEMVKTCRRKLPSKYEPPAITADSKPSYFGKMGADAGFVTPEVTLEDQFWYALVKSLGGKEALEEVAGTKEEEIPKLTFPPPQ